MDEIIIDDKKYVSSKQAAKLTGYAKDYVGQLCREGRVQARLVGRAWYVLESAIQDHRFGTPDAKTDTKSTESIQEDRVHVLQPTWETPRYETTVKEVLPPIRRTVVHTEADETVKTSQVQASWEAWFDLVAEETTSAAAIPEREPVVTKTEEVAEEQEEPAPVEKVSIDIPLRKTEEEAVIALPPRPRRRKNGRRFVKALVALSMLTAFTTAGLAVVNSGFIDKYIYSFSRARIFTGISEYIKGN